MLLEIYDVYGCSWNFIRNIRLPIKCEECSEEMQQVSQGMTDYKWYKDFYCPKCKTTIVKLDKDHKQKKHEIGVNY
tara:strand:+ start:346 stop:573 length:228 start_codon:yes stop_codon:yes gene_type:complete